MPTVDDAAQMRGMTAVDRDGDKLGKIEDIYLDEETGKPEWIALKTGMFGGHRAFVPLADARAPVTRSPCPTTRPRSRTPLASTTDGQLSQDEEAGSTATTAWTTARRAQTAGSPRATERTA